MRFALYPILFESVMHSLVSYLFIHGVFPIEEQLFGSYLARKFKQMTRGMIEIGCVEDLKWNTEFRQLIGEAFENAKKESSFML